jgi:hypothetical protein
MTGTYRVFTAKTVCIMVPASRLTRCREYSYLPNGPGSGSYSFERNANKFLSCTVSDLKIDVKKW